MSGAPRRAPQQAQGDAHTARPTDLVALVTFGSEVYENQAVTRERLARPNAAPHPLNAALKQWLGRQRHTWIDVSGRQIDGIATARPLASNDAWVIDTLVDASATGGEGVVTALLQQAVAGATEQRVTRVLLRTIAEAPAVSEALRSGFKPALTEQLWSGAGLLPSDAPAGEVHVREACKEDTFALFQLFNRAIPVGGRQALALTLDEWQSVQERRWLGRGTSEYVAVDGDRISAAMRVAPAGKVAQFDLLADAEGAAGAAALLDVAARLLAHSERVLALVPRCAAPLEGLLRERGMENGPEYVLLSTRTTRAVKDPQRIASGVAVRGV